MLDKRTARMLENIVDCCGDGSYKIIEIKDLISGMRPRFRMDADGVAQILKFLADNEMLDIKYSDENVFCVAVLPRGRVYDESKAIDRRDLRHVTLVAIITMVGSFVAAFLGALLANFIK